MTTTEETRTAAFEFGRRLGDAKFRNSLPKTKLGAQEVLVVVEDTPVSVVVKRALSETQPPVLVAIRRANGDFVFLRFRISLRGLLRAAFRRRRPTLPPREITIGAWYDRIKAERHGADASQIVRAKPVMARALHAH